MMSHVEVEDVGAAGADEHKPVLYFVGKTKGLVMNKTNASTIAEAYGDDTDQWVNQPLTIYPTTTDYAGKRVACIRVEVPRQAAKPPARSFAAAEAGARPAPAQASALPQFNPDAEPVDDGSDLPF